MGLCLSWVATHLEVEFLEPCLIFWKKKKDQNIFQRDAPAGASVVEHLTAKKLHYVRSHQQYMRVLISPHPSGTCYDLFKEIPSLLLFLLFC